MTTTTNKGVRVVVYTLGAMQLGVLALTIAVLLEYEPAIQLGLRAIDVMRVVLG